MGRFKAKRWVHTVAAIWRCDVVECVDAQGKLRVGITLVTPHDDIYHGEFTGYAPREERLATIARLIEGHYDETPWHRRPRVVEATCPDLVDELRALDFGPAVRVGTLDAQLTRVRQEFEERAKVTWRRWF